MDRVHIAVSLAAALLAIGLAGKSLSASHLVVDDPTGASAQDAGLAFGQLPAISNIPAAVLGGAQIAGGVQLKIINPALTGLSGFSNECGVVNVSGHVTATGSVNDAGGMD